MGTDMLAGYLKLAAEAKARAIMAEPVPIIGDQLQQRIIDDTNHGNAMDFLTSSRTDIPALASAVEALAAEVRRLTALTTAVDLLQAENVALRAEVAKMSPLWHLHQTPPDGVTYTVHQSISSQEQP